MIYTAKTYCHRFLDAIDIDSFNNEIVNIIKSLSEEVNELIEKRHCKTDNTKKSCLLEINNKWKAICNRYDYEVSKFPEDDYHHTCKLNESGFKACFVEMNPGTEKLFDLKAFKENLKQEENKINNAKLPFMYELIPLHKIIEDNIISEILNILYAMSQYRRVFPLHMLRPLMYRVTLLMYWKEYGIDKSLIEPFDNNPKKNCMKS